MSELGRRNILAVFWALGEIRLLCDNSATTFTNEIKLSRSIKNVCFKLIQVPFSLTFKQLRHLADFVHQDPHQAVILYQLWVLTNFVI